MNHPSFSRLLLGLAFVGLVGLALGAAGDDRKKSPVPSNPTGFTTYLGPSWTTLVGRTGPNTSSAAKHEYHKGKPIKVVAETTHGETISRGRLDGRKSSVWYRTSDGYWIWSGGTDRPVWNK
jgi:hypothetical protein